MELWAVITLVVISAIGSWMAGNSFGQKYGLWMTLFSLERDRLIRLVYDSNDEIIDILPPE